MTTPNKAHTVASDGRDFVITRLLSAPCALVYQAWTDPRQMVQWWSPQGVECRSVTADVRPGGTYRIHMVSEQGDHVAIGAYRQIIPNRRLQFTWQWEHYPMPDSLVTVEFEDLGKTTRLTLTHSGLPVAEDVPDHPWGWTSALEKFAVMIEFNQIK
jgi:uncharacterized protein YndB with AHSA1/START domain